MDILLRSPYRDFLRRAGYPSGQRHLCVSVNTSNGKLHCESNRRHFLTVPNVIKSLSTVT